MIKAVVARLIFGIHSFVAIWRVTDVKGPVYWCLALALALLTAEGVMTLWKKKGAEWKWWVQQPSARQLKFEFNLSIGNCLLQPSPLRTGMRNMIMTML
jgi:hypothetical protein